jgi:prefoldin beta subunit
MVKEEAEKHEELEKQIMEFQNAQRQLEVLLMQKQQVLLQLEEIRVAGEELEKSKGKIYRGVGTLLFQSTKEETKQDLDGKRELLDLRAKTFSKQEEMLRKMYGELKEKIESATKKKE